MFYLALCVTKFTHPWFLKVRKECAEPVLKRSQATEYKTREGAQAALDTMTAPSWRVFSAEEIEARYPNYEDV